MWAAEAVKYGIDSLCYTTPKVPCMYVFVTMGFDTAHLVQSVKASPNPRVPKPY